MAGKQWPIGALESLDTVLDAASAQISSARSAVRAASAALSVLESDPAQALVHLQVDPECAAHQAAVEDANEMSAAAAEVAIFTESIARLAAERWELAQIAVAAAGLDDTINRLTRDIGDSDTYWAPLHPTAAAARLAETAQVLAGAIKTPVDAETIHSSLVDLVGHSYQVAVAYAITAADSYAVAAIDAIALASVLADPATE